MIQVGLLLLAILCAASASQARSHYVQGAGDVPLATTKVGPADAPGVLFLHGMSGKPSDERDYVTTAIWAEDAARVMQAANMNRAVEVAWSYGALVARDTIHAKAGQKIAEIVLVGALGGLMQSPSAIPPADLIEARKLLLIPDALSMTADQFSL